MLEDITPLYQTGSTTIGSCGNLVVVIGTGDPTSADIRAVGTHCRRMQSSWKSGYGLLLCIAAESSAPSREVRDLSISLFKSISESCFAMGTAFLGQGFGAAAKRSAFSVILLGARSKTPSKVFGSVVEAADWVVGYAEGKDGARFNREILSANLRRMIHELTPA